MIMNKFYMIFAGLALLLGSASCNKIDNGGVKTPDVKIDIQVAELGTSTKAIKTGWTEGDVVNVYLSDATSYVPDFTLTYDGEAWTPSEMTDEVKARLQENGTIKGFWEASNTAASTGGDWDRYVSYISFNQSNSATSGVKQYLTACFSTSYTYADGSLTAAIDSWTFPQGLIQIVVTGLEHDQFCLTQDNIMTLNMYDITDDNIEPSPYGAGRRIAGIENEDGLAFVGCLNTNLFDGHEFTLKLYDLEDDSIYTFTKTLETDLLGFEHNLNAIKIPFSKFELEGTIMPDIIDGGEL